MLLSLGIQAAIIQIDLSPLAGTALTNANYALGDHTTGLSALNAVGQPASPASGNEIGAGIFFDDVSKQLTWNIGYGSDFGFTDLAGNFSLAHIHGPVAVQFPSPNTGAGVQLGMTHTPGSSALTGSFSGSATLTATQEGYLLDNLLYVNVHSAFAGSGEIRGQLVPVVPEPSSIALMSVVGGIGLFMRRRLRR
jgi:hypothetical protein